MRLFRSKKETTSTPSCEPEVDLGKRRFLTLSTFAQTPPRAVRRQAARPPFAVDDDLFVRLCDGCGACEVVCPQGVIVLDRGVAALDLSYAACDFCGRCQHACPTIALSNPPSTTGLVAYATDSCDNLNGYCDNCTDRCTHQALTWQEGAKPRIDATACVGCGECAASCFTNVIQLRLSDQ